MEKQVTSKASRAKLDKFRNGNLTYGFEPYGSGRAGGKKALPKRKISQR